MEDFFDVVFKYHPNKVSAISSWLTMLSKYRQMMDHVLSRYDFTDDEIKAFQRDADAFYKKWTELTGREGMSNYIHIFGSGHASWYLKRHRNFYRYTNQSWVSSRYKYKYFLYIILVLYLVLLCLLLLATKYLTLTTPLYFHCLPDSH